ncbi:MAG: zinc chelation protein SecC [Crenarchaeota archaeon]|nr:zinc chelation protein SecC [Thermoproteota archaeon]
MTTNNNEYEKEANYLLKPDLSVFDSAILNSIIKKKNTFKICKNEKLANLGWLLENVYLVKRDYCKCFDYLHAKEYEKAWFLLDNIDVSLSLISDNFDNAEMERYNLIFLRRQVHNLQKLFPYIFFISRECVIKKEKCSICGKENSLRSFCEHEPGKLYCGELCLMEVTDADLKSFAIVKNPADKYCILKPDGIGFNYFIIEYYLKESKGLFEPFDVIESFNLLPVFEKIGDNDLCPCGSGKKYQECCKGTENEKFKHIELVFPHDIDKSIRTIQRTTHKK